MRPSPYHLLSAAGKVQYASRRMREPAMHCPRCDAAVLPAELIPHIRERCVLPDPHPLCAWLTLPEACKLGISVETLCTWARSGLVRMKGPKRKRLYLYRDIVRMLAMRLARKPATQHSKENIES